MRNDRTNTTKRKLFIQMKNSISLNDVLAITAVLALIISLTSVLVTLA